MFTNEAVQFCHCSVSLSIWCHTLAIVMVGHHKTRLVLKSLTRAATAYHKISCYHHTSTISYYVSSYIYLDYSLPNSSHNRPQLREQT